MFVFSFKASSFKLLAAICLCLVIAAGVISLLPDTGAYLNVNKLEVSKELSSIDVKKEEGRIEYLKKLGFEVKAQPEGVVSEKVPKVFDAVYEKYNDLQRSQGFDLKRYSGKKVTSYTYEVTSLSDNTKIESGKYFATLIVFKNRVIAADLSCPEREEYYPVVKIS